MRRDSATISQTLQALPKARLHFMGVAGVGMSGLARWYAADGYPVTGCDAFASAEVESLRKQGIEVALGHAADHAQDTDILVSTMAVPWDHPEIKVAQNAGKVTLRRIELLAQLLQSRRSVGISGTHGKSTTTGMTASIFLNAHTDPSILVGGQLAAVESNMRYGQGEWLIAEIDESDPGFAHLHTQIAVITNLEDDHIAGDYAERRNYHASLADLEEATRIFATQAEQVLYCADWPQLTPILAGLEHTLSYGFAPEATYRAQVHELAGAGSHFTFEAPGESCEVQLIIPGQHNVQNATAALAVAHLAGLDLKAAAAELATFAGVGRRWQRRGGVAGALVIDDYAHHPTEVAVTLEAARHTGRRVRAVLQPHRWVRTARHWRALADAAALADEILVLDIYSAGESPIAGISSELIVERLQGAGKMSALYSAKEAQDYLARSLKENDLIITLGAGDVWKVAQGLVDAHGGDDGSA